MKKTLTLLPLLVILTACGASSVSQSNVNNATSAPVLSEAMEKLDLDKPSTTPEEDTARLQRAVLQQNSDVCSGIADSKKKDTCFTAVIHGEAALKGDVALCSKLTDVTQQMLCKRGVIYQKSVKEDKKEICKELAESQMITDCEQNYVYISAVKKKDSAMCAELTNPSYKSQCEEQVKIMTTPMNTNTIPVNENKPANETAGNQNSGNINMNTSIK